MRKADGRVSQLPRDFPGVQVCSLDVRDFDDYGCVTLYASVPRTGVAALCRFNLFAELQGVQQHVASAFGVTGFSGLLLSVSGFCADSWHCYAQGTSQTTGNVKVALVGLDCCAEPAVRIQATQMEPNFLIEADWFDQQFTNPPRAPLGLEHGNYVALAGGVTAGPTAFPFPGAIAPAGGQTRIIHWRFLGSGATGQLTFLRQSQSILVVPVGSVFMDGFPKGNLVADTIIVEAANHFLVEGVQ